MAFGGKLDIRLISADLSQLDCEDNDQQRREEMRTNVKIVIDDVTVGSSAVETGAQPEWGENFSIELSSLSELRAEVYSHGDPAVPGETVLVAQCLAGLADLGSEGSQEQTAKYTLELRPTGQIVLELTFQPRQTELRREKIMQETNYLHRGHRYKVSSFCDLIKCAVCQVSPAVFLLH